MTGDNVWLHGSQEPTRRPLQLTAGRLELVYENGDLRHIELGHSELIRRIYVTVRDQHWGTVQPVIENEHITAEATHFSIEYDARHRSSDVDFEWHARIDGTGESTIRWTMEGTARKHFARTRIGLCALLPVSDCIGRPCTIETPAATLVESSFPDTIHPTLPFPDIRGMTWQINNDAEAILRLTGEDFECEDQRNWGDDSFKIYPTPLRIPWPVEVEQGDRFRQEAELRLLDHTGGTPRTTHLSFHSSDRKSRIVVTDEKVGCVPVLGLQTNPEAGPLIEREHSRLSRMGLRHLRVDLSGSDDQAKARLAHAAAVATAIRADLEVAIHLEEPSENQLGRLRNIVATELSSSDPVPPIGRWLVFSADSRVTKPGAITAAKQQLRDLSESAQFAAGTDRYYVEINRQHPDLEDADAIVFSANPQVHADDDSSILETPKVFGMLVSDLHRFDAGLPATISTLTLKPPTGLRSIPPVVSSGLPDDVDPRQCSLLAAAWTLATLSAVAYAGVRSITCFEDRGYRGVIGHPSSHLPPFDQFVNRVFPLYHVLADYGEFGNGSLLRVDAGASDKIAALAMQSDGRTRLIVANLTLSAQGIECIGLPTAADALRLDLSSVDRATSDPEHFRSARGEPTVNHDGKWSTEVGPYGILRIDFDE